MSKKQFLNRMIGLGLIFAVTMAVTGSALAEKPKVIELSFAHTIPPVIPMGKLCQQWADMIAERSGGRVKINIYWGESLLKAAEFYRGVQTGQADISYYVVGLDWGLMPLNMFTKLGFMGYPSMTVGTEIYNKIYAKFPELGEEFKGVKVLSPRMSPGIHLHFTKEEVRVPSDIKGMKIAALGGTLAEEMVAMGAAAMDVKVGDLYMSLDRGLADGITSHFPVLHGFGILKLLPFHTMFGAGAVMSLDMMIMNLKTWNKLPPDIQNIFEDLSPWFAQEAIKMDLGYEAMVIGQAKEMGHKFIHLTPDEMQQWIDAVQPVHEKWIKETEEKGLPAKAVYEEAKRLIKEYGK